MVKYRTIRLAPSHILCIFSTPPQPDTHLSLSLSGEQVSPTLEVQPSSAHPFCPIQSHPLLRQPDSVPPPPQLNLPPLPGTMAHSFYLFFLCQILFLPIQVPFSANPPGCAFWANQLSLLPHPATIPTPTQNRNSTPNQLSLQLHPGNLFCLTQVTFLPHSESHF